eukprot:g4910.t1
MAKKEKKAGVKVQGHYLAMSGFDLFSEWLYYDCETNAPPPQGSIIRLSQLPTLAWEVTLGDERNDGCIRITTAEKMPHGLDPGGKGSMGTDNDEGGSWWFDESKKIIKKESNLANIGGKTNFEELYLTKEAKKKLLSSQEDSAKKDRQENLNGNDKELSPPPFRRKGMYNKAHHKEWKKHHCISQQEVHLVRCKILQQAYANPLGMNFHRVFREMDISGDKVLSYDEFSHGVHSLVRLTDDDVYRIIAVLDPENKKYIEYANFLDFLKNEPSAKLMASHLPPFKTPIVHGPIDYIDRKKQRKKEALLQAKTFNIAAFTKWKRKCKSFISQHTIYSIRMKILQQMYISSESIDIDRIFRGITSSSEETKLSYVEFANCLHTIIRLSKNDLFALLLVFDKDQKGFILHHDIVQFVKDEQHAKWLCQHLPKYIKRNQDRKEREKERKGSEEHTSYRVFSSTTLREEGRQKLNEALGIVVQQRNGGTMMNSGFNDRRVVPPHSSKNNVPHYMVANESWKNQSQKHGENVIFRDILRPGHRLSGRKNFVFNYKAMNDWTATHVISQDEIRMLRCKLEAYALQSPKGYNFRSLFKWMDKTNSGKLNYEDFARCVRKFARLSQRDLFKLISILDQNNDGFISYEEFLSWMTDEDVVKNLTHNLPKHQKRIDAYKHRWNPGYSCNALDEKTGDAMEKKKARKNNQDADRSQYFNHEGFTAWLSKLEHDPVSMQEVHVMRLKLRQQLRMQSHTDNASRSFILRLKLEEIGGNRFRTKGEVSYAVFSNALSHLDGISENDVWICCFVLDRARTGSIKYETFMNFVNNENMEHHLVTGLPFHKAPKNINKVKDIVRKNEVLHENLQLKSSLESMKMKRHRIQDKYKEEYERSRKLSQENKVLKLRLNEGDSEMRHSGANINKAKLWAKRDLSEMERHRKILEHLESSSKVISDLKILERKTTDAETEYNNAVQLANEATLECSAFLEHLQDPEGPSQLKGDVHFLMKQAERRAKVLRQKEKDAKINLKRSISQTAAASKTAKEVTKATIHSVSMHLWYLLQDDGKRKLLQLFSQGQKVCKNGVQTSVVDSEEIIAFLVSINPGYKNGILYTSLEALKHAVSCYIEFGEEKIPRSLILGFRSASKKSSNLQAKFFDDFHKEMLIRIANARKCHGCSDREAYLKWDNDLAHNAQAWAAWHARERKKQGETYPTFRGYIDGTEEIIEGELPIYVPTLRRCGQATACIIADANPQDTEPKEIAVAAIDQWISVEDSYDFEFPGHRKTGTNANVENFTSLIWKNNTCVGVGVETTQADSGKYLIYVVANFAGGVPGTNEFSEHADDMKGCPNYRKNVLQSGSIVKDSPTKIGVKVKKGNNRGGEELNFYVEKFEELMEDESSYSFHEDKEPIVVKKEKIEEAFDRALKRHAAHTKPKKNRSKKKKKTRKKREKAKKKKTKRIRKKRAKVVKLRSRRT